MGRAFLFKRRESRIRSLNAPREEEDKKKKRGVMPAIQQKCIIFRLSPGGTDRRWISSVPRMLLVRILPSSSISLLVSLSFLPSALEHLFDSFPENASRQMYSEKERAGPGDPGSFGISRVPPPSSPVAYLLSSYALINPRRDIASSSGAPRQVVSVAVH